MVKDGFNHLRTKEIQRQLLQDYMRTLEQQKSVVLGNRILTMTRFTSLILCLCFSTGHIFTQETTIPPGYSLTYEQSFDDPSTIEDFEMSDSRAWRIHQDHDSSTLELFGKSEYEARVRSPFNIAMLKSLQFGDFILEVDLAQTGREYGHRDLCLFFSMKDPTNFYYVHMASVADDHANNIFLVNDEPRIKIASKTSKGTDWGATNSWHKVRIERNIREGNIKVYFDNMQVPVMEATDTHFEFGHIGFGSFDDTGRFDNIRIWAPALTPEKATFFK